MSSPIEHVASSADRPVVQNLIKILKTAEHLRVLLQPALAEHSAAQATLDELMNSVSRALSLLASGAAAVLVADAGEEDRRCEVSGGTKRKNDSVGDGRRVCRRRSQPYSLTKVLSKTLEDGHTWRKYGQKFIQSAKHPRSYFRCTHKHEQGCKAIRQVQKSEEVSSMYIITYLGEHTCKDPSMVPHIMTAFTSKDTHLISFGTGSAEKMRQQVPLPPSPVSSLKQECCDKEVLSTLTTVSSSSPEYFPAVPETENPAVIAQIAQAAYEHGDVTSCLQPYAGNLEMGFMEDLFEIERLFGFDTDNFFSGA